MENKIFHLKSNSQGLDSWISMIDEKVVGHIYMQVQTDNKIKFLDAWVHSDYRRMGIYRSLYEERWNYVNDNYKGYIVYAWCKDSSLPIFLEKEFNLGETAIYVEKII
jgi:ribosomal protein S18 acetylase RimI-like enzyme